MKTKPWRASASAIAGMFPLAVVHAEDDTAALRKEVEQLRQELSELRALVKSQGQTAATKDEVTAVKTEVSRAAVDAAKAEHRSAFVARRRFG